jgi:hypothetical protein
MEYYAGSNNLSEGGSEVILTKGEIPGEELKKTKRGVLRVLFYRS